MIITEMVPYTKGRYKVYIDDEFAFVLYKGDISSCRLSKDQEISAEVYEQIFTEILPKRAFGRALNLLEHKDYTEYEIRKKMIDGLYPEEVIDKALTLLKESRFIDDHRYALRFVELHYERESTLAIKQKLGNRGINRDVIADVISEYEADHEDASEEAVLRSFIERKHICPEKLTYEESQKLRMSLMRKGFSSSAISAVLRHSDYDI